MGRDTIYAPGKLLTNAQSEVGPSEAGKFMRALSTRFGCFVTVPSYPESNGSQPS